MSPLRDRADRAIEWIDRAVGALALAGNVALIALVCVTVVAVFFRYVLNDPLFGIDDVSRMTLSVAVACSLAYGGRQGSLVSVDVISMIAGRTVTRWTDPIVRLLGVAIVAVTVYALFKQGSCGARCGHFTPNLAIPFWPFYVLMALGIGLYGLVLAAEFVIGLLHFRADRDPNERD